MRLMVRWPSVGPILLVVSLLVVRVTSLTAQASTSRVTSNDERRAVAAGERYRAGGLKRFFLGGGYRTLWTTPVEAEVLDLVAVAEGLTPLRAGGSGQSRTLHFQGGNGRRYVVRSIDKDPTRRLIEDLRGTFVEGVVQDQISSLHPFAALIVDPLLDATDILHAEHSLVIIPDDPRLGEFRKEFAGMMGMLVERPDEGADNTPGFAGSTRIVSSDRLLERLRESSRDRVDARAFLKARFVDFIIGDKDRHQRQWRWASFPDGGDRVWRPIPEDRDQAFVDFDGLVMAFTRIVRPQQVGFGPTYPSTVGLTFNGWEIDRYMLAELEKPVWDAMVQTVQTELTTDVIDAAVRRLPPSHYQLSGPFIAASLKARRDKLSDVAEAYYRLINRWVDIHATGEDEQVEINHLASGGVDVTISAVAGRPGDSRPYYRRRFSREETKEIRLYLHGGDDDARVTGEGGKITVRVIGGNGNDRFVNDSRAGARRTRFYDARGQSEFVKGVGARVNVDDYERPPSTDQIHQYALDWGGRNITAPFFTYDPDLGLYFGGYHSVERYGFRKSPYTARHIFRAGFATAGAEPVLSYTGRYRQIGNSVDATLGLKYAGIDVLHFYGFGNETDGGSSSFFEVEQRQATVEPMLRIVPTKSFEVAFGPMFKAADTDAGRNADNFIAIDPPYGTGFFTQLGAQASVTLDTRDRPGNARKGVYFTAGGSVYPDILDVVSTFGEVHGEMSTYLSANIPTRPTLALRAGGKRVWGTFPFHESAFLGGGETLRGFRSQRFAGDASVYGNAEMRLDLARVRFLIPGRFGVFGFGDAGRVFFDDDPDGADRLHRGYGAGVWMSFLQRKYTVSAAVADGDDLTGLYVRAGFLF